MGDGMKIPECNNCKENAVFHTKPETTTCMYFPPIFNAKGENINPDRNKVSGVYGCECGNIWNYTYEAYDRENTISFEKVK